MSIKAPPGFKLMTLPITMSPGLKLDKFEFKNVRL